MSSYLTTPTIVSPAQQSVETSVATLWGSFQGNGASAPLAAQFRGSWFSAVTRIAAGQYRVQVNYNIPNNIVPVNGTGVGNGQPNGLLAEAVAWVTYDAVAGAQSGATIFTAAPAAVAVQCTKLDKTTNINTFDIFISSTGGATFTGVDPTASQRVFFELTWKTTPVTP